MPFDSRVHGHTIYVRWRNFAIADLSAVAQEISALTRATCARVRYLSRVPADNRVFTAEESAVLRDFLLAILPDCASIHHVLEGEGFTKSARRAVVAGMARVTPRPRDFHTHDSIADALTWIAAATATSVDELTSALTSRVTPPCPRSAMRVKSVPPARASSAFRAAVRIAASGPSRRAPRKG